VVASQAPQPKNEPAMCGLKLILTPHEAGIEQLWAAAANISFRALFLLFSACRPIKSPSSDIDGLLIRHTS
jgi:hypothetical protein